MDKIGIKTKRSHFLQFSQNNNYFALGQNTITSKTGESVSVGYIRGGNQRSV